MKTTEETLITVDDPRLTAYALGELEGDEAAAVAAAVAADPTLAAEVDAVRAFGAGLAAELAAEPAPALDAAARAAILTGGRAAANDEAGPVAPRRAWRGWLAAGLFLAAGTVAAVALSGPGADPARPENSIPQAGKPGGAAPAAAAVEGPKARGASVSAPVAEAAPAAPRGESGAVDERGVAAARSRVAREALELEAAPVDGLANAVTETSAKKDEKAQAQGDPAKALRNEDASDLAAAAVASGALPADRPAGPRRARGGEAVALGALDGDAGGAMAGVGGMGAGGGGRLAGASRGTASGTAGLDFDNAMPSGSSPPREPKAVGTKGAGEARPLTAAVGQPGVPMEEGLAPDGGPALADARTSSGDALPQLGQGYLAGQGKSARQNMYRGLSAGGRLGHQPMTTVLLQLPDGSVIEQWVPYDQVPYPNYRYVYPYDPYYYPWSPYEGERYAPIVENPFKRVAEAPLSTFSTDIDTASYSNVRRYLERWQRPPVDAVRLEELVNAQTYATPVADDGQPVAVAAEVTACPWAPTHRLVRVALAAREVAQNQRPAGNLVFLIDTSGSMAAANKLPLLKNALRELVLQLDERDTVTLVTYAGHAGVALPPTNGSDKPALLAAIARLRSAGMTNGSAGLQLAYQLARDNFVPHGTNRVLLATDGDFNAGMTSNHALVQLVQREAVGQVYLTVLGLGTGNLKDDRLEAISNQGDGTYAYLADAEEARRVLVDQLSGTLVTVAKDVKIQVEWNPAKVAAYRLLGYENRALADQDFDNDQKDAGDLGAGTRVTALYEVVPVGAPRFTRPRPPTGLKYQPAANDELEVAPVTPPVGPPWVLAADEMMTVKVRYKAPEGGQSQLLEVPLVDDGAGFQDASPDLRLAAAAASFAMLLRGSRYRGVGTWDATFAWAASTLADVEQPDAEGRAKLVWMIERARQLYTGR